MNDYRTMQVTHPRPGVVLASLSRPERMNAMNFEMFDEFVALQREVDADPHARVLVLTGVGRGFCSGLDLSDAQKLPHMDAAEMLAGQEHWADAVTGFRMMDTPVIAAVNGAAAGAGFGLALAADIRIASDNAKFNAAFVRIGLSGGDVGTSWALPRLIGMAHASEILLTGRFVLADEAYRIGLVSRVVSSESLLDSAFDIAGQITANSPFAMRLTKRVLRENVDASSLQDALVVENRNQVLITRTGDMREALQAFLDKRAAVFTGK